MVSFPVVARDIFFFKTFRSIRPLTQRVPRVLSSGIKRAGYEGDHSFASSAQDKTYLYSPYRMCLRGMHRATVPFWFKNVMFVSIRLCSSPQNSREDMPES